MRIHEKRTSFALIVLIVIAISTPLVTFFYGYSTGYLKGSSKGRYFALLEVERTFKEGLLGKSTIYLMGADGELMENLRFIPRWDKVYNIKGKQQKNSFRGN